MVNPQLEDGYIRIANEIWEQIMMRDFTKRQRAILDLILRLSWGCQRKVAHIPRQADFEIVGVGRTNVKQELEWLVSAKVIAWDKDEMIFELNKRHSEWRVSISRGYDEGRLRDLVALNLSKVIKTRTKSYQNDNSEPSKQEQKVIKTITPSYQNKNHELSKQEPEVIKTITPSYQNNNSEVIKTITPASPKANVDAPYKPPKDSIKNSLKTIKDIPTFVSLCNQKGKDPLYEAWHTLVGMSGPAVHVKLDPFITELGMEIDVAIAAIMRGVERLSVENRKPPPSYVEGVLRNWYNDGIRSLGDLHDRQLVDDDDSDEDLPEGLRNALRSIRARQEREGGGNRDTA